MSEKKHELYLISFALILTAALLLYNVFNTPNMNAVEIIAGYTTTVQSVQVYENDISSDTQSSATKNTAAEAAAAQDDSQGSLININTATIEELMTLTGIGEVKAQAIIDYREENGNFVSVDDLLNVKGIGEKTLEKIRDSVIV